MTDTMRIANEWSTTDVRESLIEDLAHGFCSTFPLTQVQEVLSIPLPMVYLAGLILSTDNDRDGGTDSSEGAVQVSASVPVVPDSAHEQLRKYCEIYNRCLLAGGKGQPLQVVAMMSPRVRPTKEQQVVIQQDIANKAKTKAMLHALLLADDKQETTKENATPQPHGVSNAKRKKKSKPKPKAKLKPMESTTALLDTCPSSTVNHNVRESLSKDAKPESLEEVIRTRLNAANDIEQVPDTYDWIEVPSLTRTATRTNYFPVQVSRPVVEKDDPNLMQRFQNTEDTYNSTSSAESPNSFSENSYLAAARAGQWTENSSDILSDSQMPQIEVQASHRGISTDQGSKIDNQVELAVGSLDSLRSRILELEQALAESNRLLQKEREQHTAELKEERERHVNSMQALQLRLYISETRLKTYQDALEEHIHSVAENVYHPNGSPPRRLCQDKDRKSPPPASPLMSRVLHKSNASRLDESF